MDLEELSLTELREKAKDAGIKSATKFKKDELISICSFLRQMFV